MNRRLSALAPVLVAALAGPMRSPAQSPPLSDAGAKEAVHRIVQHSGLAPVFTVRADPSLRTANAYIKGGERVIAYNPAFIATVLDSSRTDWAAVSILAHEIGHHLLGHTLGGGTLHPGDELACDRYSGFILQRMGATQEECLAAMEVAGNVHGTPTHPPRHARLEAIRLGFEEGMRACEPGHRITVDLHDDFVLVVRFAGDANTYYVNDRDELVWYDAHARPIAFGSYQRRDQVPYSATLTWQDRVFQADHAGVLWAAGANGLERQVGRMDPFVPQRP